MSEQPAIERLVTVLDRLDRTAHFEVVARRDRAPFQPRVLAEARAREICHQSVVGWSSRSSAAVNAVLRSIRREGPMDSLKVSTLMAAAEDAAHGILALPAGLSESEYALLTQAVAPWLDGEMELPEPTPATTPPSPARARAPREKREKSGLIKPAVMEKLEAIVAAAQPKQVSSPDDIFGGGFDNLLADVVDNPAPAVQSASEIFGRQADDDLFDDDEDF